MRGATVTGTKRYTCDDCEKDFSRSQALAGHVRFVHEGFNTRSRRGRRKRAIRQIVDKNGGKYSVKAIRSSVRKHRSGVRVRCSVCKNLFYNQSSLKRHMTLIHLSRNPEIVSNFVVFNDGVASVAKKFCPYCGDPTYVADGVKFCVSCGSNIEAVLSTNGASK